MKLIKLKITPLSSFATFPKGDTLFGHFAYLSFFKNENIFEKYATEKKPKIIFSDILPDNHLYKPTLPLDAFGVDESKKKEFRKKSWISYENLNKGALKEAVELTFMQKEFNVRNTLNRVSFTTDSSGMFAPYGLEESTFVYQPVIYVMFDDTFTDKEIEKRVNEIGKNAFGKKGSIGKGYFKAKIDKSFEGFQKIKTKNCYMMTLSPTLLHKSKELIADEEVYYNTFNRFGKYHSSSTPFKKPLLMADSGAVVKLKSYKQYIGGGIDNGIGRQSLVQGFSILVPFEFEGVKSGKEKK
jgi:CRISPR/Cas system CSM-associated protein Csm4 (group 5 of RAMP superfamily)